MKWILVLVLVSLPAVSLADPTHICFTESESNRILQILELSPVLTTDLEACDQAVRKCDNLVAKCNEQLEYRAKEIQDLVSEREECVELLKDTEKAAKVVAKGSLWDRIKNNALAAGIGGLIALLIVVI
jgi:hypothetical protein